MVAVLRRLEEKCAAIAELVPRVQRVVPYDHGAIRFDSFSLERFVFCLVHAPVLQASCWCSCRSSRAPRVRRRPRT